MEEAKEIKKHKHTLNAFFLILSVLKEKFRKIFEFAEVKRVLVSKYFDLADRNGKENLKMVLEKLWELPERRKNIWFKKSAIRMLARRKVTTHSSLLRLRLNGMD